MLGEKKKTSLLLLHPFYNNIKLQECNAKSVEYSFKLMYRCPKAADPLMATKQHSDWVIKIECQQANPTSYVYIGDDL